MTDLENAWTASLGDWLERASAAAPSEAPDDLLCTLRDMFETAPVKLRAVIGELSNKVEFELLLQTGAAETASRRLLGTAPFGFMLSRSPHGGSICSVWIPGAIEETRFDADTEALAFAGALARAYYQVLMDSPAPGAPSLKLVKD